MNERPLNDDLSGRVSASCLTALVALLALSACGDPAGTDTTGPSRDAAEDAAGDASDGAAADDDDADASDAHTDSLSSALDTASNATDGAADTSAAAPLALAVACEDSPDEVYLTPPALPPWSPLSQPEGHGEVLRCAPDGHLTAAEVAAHLGSRGDAAGAPRGVSRYLIAYRTERASGVAGVGTAFVLVPDPEPSTPDASATLAPTPLVVAAHGTVGLADPCAPSKRPDVSDALVLPFAAAGALVIAPDYAGLGNEGTQGYGDARDTAHSVLDAARAAARLVAPGALSGRVIISGHSQGGGATLSAVALAPSYAPELDLAAAVPFAPGWMDSPDLNAAGYRFPGLVSTSLGAGVTAAVTVLALYADQANAVGVAQAGRFFHPDVREELVSLIESRCVLALAVEVPKLAGTFAGLLAPEFTAGVSACLTGGTCDEPYAGYVERARANYLPLSAAAPPLLYLQGGQDAQATPARAACYVQALTDMGVSPQVCVDPEATHFNIVDRQSGFAISWLSALIAGRPAPACTVSGTLPPCDP